jgi:hypothetical protein
MILISTFAIPAHLLSSVTWKFLSRFVQTMVF